MIRKLLGVREPEPAARRPAATENELARARPWLRQSGEAEQPDMTTSPPDLLSSTRKSDDISVSGDILPNFGLLARVISVTGPLIPLKG